MKRVLTVLVLLSGACVLHAEQMTFVTTLSSPLGTFAQLETADYSATTSVPLLNFCNTRSSAGTVALKGADTYLQTLSLKNGTTLGGNTPEYRISGTLSVNNNSEVTGGRLLADNASVSGASAAKSKVDNTLYITAATVKGAKTAVLTLPSQVETGASSDDVLDFDMHWSDQYKKDYKCTGGSCTESGKGYTSYLLKSIKSTCQNTVESCLAEGKIYKDADCSCQSCPSGKITLDGQTCRYQFVGEVKDVKVLAKYYNSVSRGDNKNTCTKLYAKMYYTGGSLPAATTGEKGNCQMHVGYSAAYYAYVNGGGNYQNYKDYYFWEASHTSGYYQGTDLPKCATSNYDSLCNSNCNANSSSCSYKCVINESIPGSTGLYYCKISGDKYYGCGNNAGTGKIVTCKLKS